LQFGDGRRTQPTNHYMKNSLINIRLANRFAPALNGKTLSEVVRATLENAMANDLVPASFGKVRGEASMPCTIRVSDDLAMWIASFEGTKSATIIGLIVAANAKPAKAKPAKAKAKK
jgi:isopentenyl phosphate kinase